MKYTVFGLLLLITFVVSHKIGTDPDLDHERAHMAQKHGKPIASDFSVPRIKAHETNLTDFIQRFISSSTPVLIEDFSLGWPAIRKWTNDYLASEIGQERIKVITARGDLFDFRREMHESLITFNSFVGLTDDAHAGTAAKKNHYFAQGEINRSFPMLKKDIILPQWADSLHLEDWMLYLATGGITSMHFDTSELLLTLVAGEKEVLLFDPTQTRNLYPVKPHNENELIGSRISDFRKVDLDRFPKFKDARGVTVTLRAGQALYVPSYWWHSVGARARTVGVNFWFRADPNLVTYVYENMDGEDGHQKVVDYAAKQKNEYKSQQHNSDDDLLHFVNTAPREALDAHVEELLQHFGLEKTKENMDYVWKYVQKEIKTLQEKKAKRGQNEEETGNELQPVDEAAEEEAEAAEVALSPSGKHKSEVAALKHFLGKRPLKSKVNLVMNLLDGKLEQIDWDKVLGHDKEDLKFIYDFLKTKPPADVIAQMRLVIIKKTKKGKVIDDLSGDDEGWEEYNSEEELEKKKKKKKDKKNKKDKNKKDKNKKDKKDKKDKNKDKKDKNKNKNRRSDYDDYDEEDEEEEYHEHFE